LAIGQTPKGDIEKNTFVCYPTFWKKETSCKFNSDIRVGVYKRQDGRELEKGVECKIA
jgi:hypothetical protein